MRVFMITLIVIYQVTFSAGQETVDFEDFGIGIDSFLNGSEADGSFVSKSITLPNNYNGEFDSWIGWSISSITDNTTPGFGNQYSAITGVGFDNSQNYAVSFEFGENKIKLNDEGNTIDGFYVTNNTYAYLSMKDGDAFAKKFGGETGNDPDFFLMTIRGYNDGEQQADSINFYLADYRFEDNSDDYLIADWTYIDVSVLGEVDSIGLSLSSSDNGQFGMNTPAYFCVDQIVTSTGMTTPVQEPVLSTLIDIYPNPTADKIFITQDVEDKIQLLLYSQTGQLIYELDARQYSEMNLEDLKSGTYYLRIKASTSQMTKMIIKK